MARITFSLLKPQGETWITSNYGNPKPKDDISNPRNLFHSAEFLPRSFLFKLRGQGLRAKPLPSPALSHTTAFPRVYPSFGCEMLGALP